MARVGGRSTWFSWFVGIVCAGVVGVLVFLAVPMVPAVLDWSGQALRGDLGQSPGNPTQEPSDQIAPEADAVAPTVPAACTDLYPESLWSLLSTASGVELLEAADFPPSTASGLPEAMGARVTLSCTWQGGSDTSVSSTIAEVADDAADTAARVLSGAGFACSPFGLGIRCQGSASGDAISETHTIRDGIWLATIENGWQPPEYATSVETNVWRS